MDNTEAFAQPVNEVLDELFPRREAVTETVNGGPIELPRAADLESALGAVNVLLEQNRELFLAVHELKKLIPKRAKEEKYTLDMFKSKFLNDHPFRHKFQTAFGLNPPGIALISLSEMFANSERFKIVDPAKLEYASKLMLPYEAPAVTHTTIEIGGETIPAPMNAEIWVEDKKLETRFVVAYQPSMSGGIGVEIEGSMEDREDVVELTTEIKKLILTSKYLRGQILEVTGGADFRVVDIGDQVMPIIDEKLKSELDKNVVNLFQKEEEFRKFGLPIKRAIILEGDPGCGKTMIARYLANSVRGKVTTIWVTAKSIQHAEDVANVFDIARKLSPSLVVMEDLDLISGTRESFIMGGGDSLGEMLNQLDGLTSNDSLVLVASTNRVSSLDEALKDRPGRFDRIFKVDRPNSDLAEHIAKDYLRKHGIQEAVLDTMNLAMLKKGEYTGAQLVEICKGAIFEAIHRGGELNELCMMRSLEGLNAQRKLIKG